MKKKDYKDEIVTKGFIEELFDKRLDEKLDKKLDEKLDIRFSAFSVEMIKEMRATIYTSINESNENMKAYYEKQTERYVGAVREEFSDMMMVYGDQMQVINDQLYEMSQEMKSHNQQMRILQGTDNDHEKRISKLEWSVNGA